MLDKKSPREKLIEEAFRRAGLDSKCLDDWKRLLRPFMDVFEFFGLSAERAEDWELCNSYQFRARACARVMGS
jgi:hypothetical protein